MKFILRRGKILRVRPGHLANFSGGAGYMLIVLQSAPVSFLFGLVGSLVLFARDPADDPGGEDTAAARTKSLLAPPSPQEGRVRRTSLYELTDGARLHLVICGVLTIAAGTLFFLMGLGSVDGSKLQYALGALLLGAGPFVAWFLSTLLLVRSTRFTGVRFVDLLLAGLIHGALVVACIMLTLFMSHI